MKNRQGIFYLFLLFFPFPLMAQDLFFSPEKPKPGEEITITYRTDQSQINQLPQIGARVFWLEDPFPEKQMVQLPMPRPRAQVIALEKKGKQFSATIRSTEQTKAMAIVLYASSGSSNTPARQGFTQLLFEPESGRPVQGAYGKIGLLYASQAPLLGLKIDQEKAFEAFQQEFDRYPASKKHYNYFLTFTGLALELNKETAIQSSKEHLARLLQEEKAGELTLSLAFALADLLDQPGQAALAFQRLEANFPTSIIVEYETRNRLYETSDLEEKEAIFQKLKKQFNETDRQQSLLQEAATNMATHYFPDELDKFSYYASLSRDPVDWASRANAEAWQLAGGGLQGYEINLDKATRLSEIALKLVQQEISQTKDAPEQYRRGTSQLKENYAAFADTYALIFYKKGEVERALEYQKLSLENDPDPAVEVVHRYAVYFDETKKEAATKEMLADFIRNNQYSPGMKDRYEELAGKKALEMALEEASKTYMEELRPKMISRTAPDFKLKSLEGEMVRLSDLKGKVVVLDFWATWCQPCIASFPGIQEVIEHYKKDEEVVFLFANCWEAVGTTEADISELMMRDNYDFLVLLDTENKVVNSYGVRGIPTKFIIDRHGQIRFESAGFAGQEKLIRELKGMIELAKEK